MKGMAYGSQRASVDGPCLGSTIPHQGSGEQVIVDGQRAKLDSGGKVLRDPETQKILTEPALVTRNSASQGPFVVIVFPNTSVKKNFVSVDASLKTVIDQRFQALTE